METIANVRSASQSERGNLEADLAALYLTSPSIETEPSPSTSDSNQYAKVYTAYPDKYLSKPADKTREEGARVRYMERLKRVDPKRWEEVEMDTDPKRWEEVEMDTDDAPAPPTVAAIASPEISEGINDPVMVIEIPFEPKDDWQVIPLNWKLTREQKSWYSEAWSRVEANQEEDMRAMRELFGAPE